MGYSLVSLLPLWQHCTRLVTSLCKSHFHPLVFQLSIATWVSLAVSSINLSVGPFSFLISSSHTALDAVSFSSVTQSCQTLWPHGLQHARPPCPSPTPEVYSNSGPLSRWCHPTISSCHPLLLPSIFPRIRVFLNESVLRISWPEYWSFSFNISPSNEYSGLISFAIDWLDLLAVQGTLKSLFQHHSSKASILWWSAFFIVQLSHPYMTTGKTIALTRWTFVGKVMPLLFNMLSRLVIAFLPRSNCLNFMAAVTICSDFGAPQNKVWHCFHSFPIYFPWSDGTRCRDLCRFLPFSECWVLSQLFHSPLSLSSKAL